MYYKGRGFQITGYIYTVHVSDGILVKTKRSNSE